MGVIIKEDKTWESVAMFNHKNPELGQEMTYPTSYDSFRHVCPISERVAMTWLDDIDYCLQLTIGYGDEEVRPIRPLEDSPYNSNGWLNKMAVVVEIRHYSIFAVYNHDDNYWLIERNMDED